MNNEEDRIQANGSNEENWVLVPKCRWRQSSQEVLYFAFFPDGPHVELQTNVYGDSE
jgi:hypothetical protein